MEDNFAYRSVMAEMPAAPGASIAEKNADSPRYLVEPSETNSSMYIPRSELTKPFVYREDYFLSDSTANYDKEEEPLAAPMKCDSLSSCAAADAAAAAPPPQKQLPMEKPKSEANAAPLLVMLPAAPSMGNVAQLCLNTQNSCKFIKARVLDLCQSKEHFFTREDRANLVFLSDTADLIVKYIDQQTADSSVYASLSPALLLRVC